MPFQKKPKAAIGSPRPPAPPVTSAPYAPVYEIVPIWRERTHPYEEVQGNVERAAMIKWRAVQNSIILKIRDKSKGYNGVTGAMPVKTFVIRIPDEGGPGTPGIKLRDIKGLSDRYSDTEIIEALKEDPMCYIPGWNTKESKGYVVRRLSDIEIEVGNRGKTKEAIDAANKISKELERESKATQKSDRPLIGGRNEASAHRNQAIDLSPEPIAGEYDPFADVTTATMEGNEALGVADDEIVNAFSEQMEDVLND